MYEPTWFKIFKVTTVLVTFYNVVPRLWAMLPTWITVWI